MAKEEGALDLDSNLRVSLGEGLSSFAFFGMVAALVRGPVVPALLRAAATNNAEEEWTGAGGRFFEGLFCGGAGGADFTLDAFFVRSITTGFDPGGLGR